jgi:membrane protease YdiL (CAAX protease family)
VKATWPVLIFAMVWPTLAAVIYFVGLASPVGESLGTNPWVQGFYGGSKLVQFTLPVLWLGLWQRQSLRVNGLNLQGLHFGLTFGLFVSLAMLGIYFGALRETSFFDKTVPQIRAKVDAFGAGTPVNFLLLASFIVIVHSLLEEYYWRWFVFGGLRQLVSVPAAIAVSGLAFMAHHVVIVNKLFPDKVWIATVPISLCVAIGGMVWAWLYNRTGSILVTWLSHLLIDAAIMGIGYNLLFC